MPSDPFLPLGAGAPRLLLHGHGGCPCYFRAALRRVLRHRGCVRRSCSRNPDAPACRRCRASPCGRCLRTRSCRWVQAPHACCFMGMADVLAISERRFAEYCAIAVAYVEAVAGIRTRLLAADVELHRAVDAFGPVLAVGCRRPTPAASWAWRMSLLFPSGASPSIAPSRLRTSKL